MRVLDQNGAGTDSAVINAINTAIQLKLLFNIRVINLSLGRPVFESYTLDPVCQAVEKAWKSGIVVVVAAGNNGRYQPTDGYGTITSPGNDPYVITVGAMKTMGTPTRVDDLIASYSSKGPTVVDAISKPDIVAPGNLLVSLEAPNSTLYNRVPGNRVPNSFYQKGGSSAASSSYFTLSGTSMATGVVSGVVADLLQKSPSLNPDQVKARLMKTAWKSFPAFSSTTDPTSGITYTDQYDVFTIGAGYVDVEAAMAQHRCREGNGDVSGRFLQREHRQRLPQRRLQRCMEHVVDVVERRGLGTVPVRARISFGHDDGHQRSLGQQRPVGKQCSLGLERVVG